MGREAQRLVDMRVKLADHTDEYVTSHHAEPHDPDAIVPAHLQPSADPA